MLGFWAMLVYTINRKYLIFMSLNDLKKAVYRYVVHQSITLSLWQRLFRNEGCAAVQRHSGHYNDYSQTSRYVLASASSIHVADY